MPSQTGNHATTGVAATSTSAKGCSKIAIGFRLNRITDWRMESSIIGPKTKPMVKQTTEISNFNITHPKAAKPSISHTAKKRP